MNTMIKNFLISTFLFSSFCFSLLLPVFAFADPIPPNSTSGTGAGVNIKLENPFKCDTGTKCTLFDLVYAVLNNIVMPIAAVAVVVWIIWAGFSFLMAQGNPGKIDAAKQNLLWALIGAGVLLGAAGIAKVVENTVEALIK